MTIGVTRSQCKTWIGISASDASQDDFVDAALSAAEAAFENLTDRIFGSVSRTEYYDGCDRRVILLRECPVASVTEVRYDPVGGWGAVADSFGASTVLTEGVDWVLVKDGKGGTAATGKLMRVTGVWPGRNQYRAGLLVPQRMPSAGTIRVQYTGGQAAPADVQGAVCQAVAMLKARRATGMLESSIGFDGASIGLMQQQAKDLMMVAGTLQQVVARYRRLTPRTSPQG